MGSIVNGMRDGIDDEQVDRAAWRLELHAQLLLHGGVERPLSFDGGRWVDVPSDSGGASPGVHVRSRSYTPSLPCLVHARPPGERPEIARRFSLGFRRGEQSCAVHVRRTELRAEPTIRPCEGTPGCARTEALSLADVFSRIDATSKAGEPGLRGQRYGAGGGQPKDISHRAVAVHATNNARELERLTEDKAFRPLRRSHSQSVEFVVATARRPLTSCASRQSIAFT